MKLITIKSSVKDLENSNFDPEKLLENANIKIEYKPKHTNNPNFNIAILGDSKKGMLTDELLRSPSKKEVEFFEAINKEMSHNITTVNLENKLLNNTDEITSILKMIGCDDVNALDDTNRTMIYLIVERIRDFASYNSNNEIEFQCEAIMKKIKDKNMNKTKQGTLKGD